MTIDLGQLRAEIEGVSDALTDAWEALSAAIARIDNPEPEPEAEAEAEPEAEPEPEAG